MEDLYKSLSDCLSTLIPTIEKFHINKNDFLKKDIRAFQIQLNSLGNSIGNIIKEHAGELNSNIDDYLSDLTECSYHKLIKHAIELKQDLFEL